MFPPLTEKRFPLLPTASMKFLFVLLLSALLCTSCDMPKFQLPLFDQRKVDSIYAKYEEHLGMESLVWSVELSYSDTTAVRKLAFTVLNCSRIAPDSDTLQYIAAHIAQDFYDILQNKNNYNEVAVSFKSEKGFIFTMNYTNTYTFPVAWLEQGISLSPETPTTSATIDILPADREVGGTSAIVTLPADPDTVPANREEDTLATPVVPATSASSFTRARY